MAMFRNVTHVIFDMDGLLLDTESINAQTFRAVLQKYGADYTNELRFKVMGMTATDTYQTFIKDCKLPVSLADFAVEVQKFYLERANAARLLPGVEKLVTHLKKHKIPMAVATSSSNTSFQFKSKNFRHVFDLFDHVTCGGSDPEVKNGKPAPDIFLVAASRFSTKPQSNECLVFEDAPNGVQGAIDAGMQVVMVPDPIVPTEKRKLATKVLSSLLEFKPEEFGLPQFESA